MGYVQWWKRGRFEWIWQPFCRRPSKGSQSSSELPEPWRHCSLPACLCSDSQFTPALVSTDPPPPSGPRPKPGEGAPQCFLGLKAHLGSPTPACALKPGVQLSPSMGASCSTLMPCLSPQHPQACLTLSQERPCSSQCCHAPWYSFERSTFSDPLV